jgi:DNA-binding transcriptional regulator GbsR (MarR family)
MGESADPDQRTGNDIREFVERFAIALSEAGIPRMPARVFAMLLTDDNGRMTAPQMAERLQVSPAAISGAVRYLVQAGLAIKGREPGARSDHYRLPEDLWYEVYFQRAPIIERWSQAADEGARVLGADTPAGRRMQETSAFFAFLRTEFRSLVERWHEHRESLRAAGELPPDDARS